MSNQPPFAKLNQSLPLPDMSGKNPFVVPSPGEVREDAPEGSYTYAPVQSAPGVPAEECEIAAAAAEIVIRWGKTTLHVAHLSPPRPFHVGEASDKAPVDFQLPAEKLGVARLPVVRRAADGTSCILIPAGAIGTLTVGGTVTRIADLATSSLAKPCADIAGAFELPLKETTRARFEIGGFEFEIASVKAGKRVTGLGSFDRRGLPFQAASMALHLGLLGAAAVLMPPMALASEDAMTTERIDSLKVILAANAEREQDPPRDAAKGNSSSASGQERNAERQTGPRGSSMGPGRNGNARSVVKDNPNATLTRDEMLALAGDFGTIQVLRNTKGAVSPWGDSELTSRYSYKGGMFDGGSLETGGSGTLTLSGVGDGSNIDGQGIPQGGIRTGGLFGNPDGTGRRPRLGRGHQANGPVIHGAPSSSSGKLPSPVIQRIVRQNFGRFRLCYEKGLAGNPSLAGRVSVRFVIGHDGGVMSAANGGSDLPDAGVVACVVGSFRGLQFPQIEDGGTATVTYPIVFSAPAR